MTTMNQVPSETAEAAIRALCEARDAARGQTHLFSAQTWRSWRELEHEIDVKLEDVEHRLAQNGLQAAEVAFARADELRRAVDALLRDNSQRAAHSIMTTSVKTCSPDDTLDQVARTLWDSDCGALPVVDAQGRVVGMITDRDLCMASFTRSAPLCACTVQPTMSKNVVTCSPDDSIQRLAEIMAHAQLRRIPVVAPDGHLLGIVTLADLARYLDSLPDEHPSRALMLRTLAAISARRTC